MIKLRILVDDIIRELESEDLEAVCSRLCIQLPIDVHYGRSSLMTCVQVVPSDKLGSCFPTFQLQPQVRGLDYAFVFKSVVSNGDAPVVLDEDFVDSITSITQRKRTLGCDPCDTCKRYENCKLEEG